MFIILSSAGANDYDMLFDRQVLKLVVLYSPQS